MGFLKMAMSVCEVSRKSAACNSESAHLRRSGIEQASKQVGVSGVFTMSAGDHNGLDLTAFEMVRITAGDWAIIQ